MPKIGLNDNDANVKATIGPIGALIPIGLVPVLMMPLSISSARVKGFSNNESVVLQTKRLYSLLPSVELSLAIQYQTVGISRTDYNYLRSILDIVAKDPKAPTLLQSLPNTLDILKTYIKGLLLFVNLRSKVVKLNLLVQPTSNVKDLVELFFFNLIEFFRAYLSSSTNLEKMFYGISYLVDAPQELYYSNAQHSSIRITSRVFAVYTSSLEVQLDIGSDTASSSYTSSNTKGKQLQKQANETTVKEKINRFIGSKDRPIFLSNVVNFRYNNTACLY